MRWCKHPVGARRQAQPLVLAVTLALTTACSRQSGTTTLSPANTSGTLPFEQVASGKGISPTEGLPAASLAKGTAVTIRLRSPLSSADSRPGDAFYAVLDEPMSAGGQKIVAERGESVEGRIAAASPGRAGQPGYLRLTLVSLVVNGKRQSLKTSSIFAKAAESTPGTPAGNPDVRFSTAQRLTFRVLQALPLPNWSGERFPF